MEKQKKAQQEAQEESQEKGCQGQIVLRLAGFGNRPLKGAVLKLWKNGLTGFLARVI